ncbi:MAG: helix-turn-helix domain-containing protein [Pseudomonadota bacterium]
MAKDDYTIRSIHRGFGVLQAINRSGSMRLMDISKSTQLPYPTVSRIVETLVELGMVERESSGRRYRPTALVQTLSAGYQEEHALVSCARPHIVKLCNTVGWPITITTRVGNRMMVRDSTHRLTTLTFNNYAPGYTLPLLECSVGKVYLAFCEDEERNSIISSLEKLDDKVDQMAKLLLRDDDVLLNDIREKGYAYHAYNQYTENPGKTSSLAVPVFLDGKLAGGLGLIFFSSSMSVAEAAEKYVDEMRETAKLIANSGASI